MDDVDNPVPMLAALLVALLAVALLRRSFAARELKGPVARYGVVRGAPLEWALVALAVGLASGPIWAALPDLASPTTPLLGDASMHAAVAKELAQHGLPHGWIEANNAGFPFGPHYQSFALLLLAGLVRLGVHPAAATSGVGTIASLLVPLLFVWLARLGGLRPAAALTGALLLAWAWPFQGYIGGPRTYLFQGLVSQVVAMPVVMLAAGALVLERFRWLAPLLGALAVLAHAQIGVAFFCLSLPVVFAFGTPRQRKGFMAAALAAAAVAIATYGPGAATFHVPFGWPDAPDFSIIGYEPERLWRWLLAGELLDKGRFPALTMVAVAAVVVVVGLCRGRVARGAGLFFALSVLAGVAGSVLVELGSPFQALVSVFSPVRALCLMPMAAAAVVGVAANEVVEHVEQLAHGSALGRIVKGVLAPGMVLGVELLIGAGMLRQMTNYVVWLRSPHSTACRIAGYDKQALAPWLRVLDRGRLVTDVGPGAFVDSCPITDLLPLESAVPQGQTLGGPGSQVGIMETAFGQLRFELAGADSRAEALGVRFVLGTLDRPPQPDGAWQVRATRERVALFERRGGTDRVGVGCVQARWRGSDRALRQALLEDVEGSRRLALDPIHLIELETLDGPVRREGIDPQGCDPRGATVVEQAREPGALQASIEAPSVLDVVLRETFFPTWTVRVDGLPASYRMVAPGFLAVRIPAGAHRLEAVAAPLRFYLLGQVVAGALVLALTWRGRRRARSSTAR